MRVRVYESACVREYVNDRGSEQVNENRLNSLVGYLSFVLCLK